MSELQTACAILADGRVASLGTLDESGYPYVSLVTVAAERPTRLILLLSGLAKHSQNLEHSDRCSLLVSLAATTGQDPLTAGRVTVKATATRLSREEDASARENFLRLHPQAEMYADFGDFAFYALDVHQAHLVAGFGRIETYSADELLSFSSGTTE